MLIDPALIDPAMSDPAMLSGGEPPGPSPCGEARWAERQVRMPGEGRVSGFRAEASLSLPVVDFVEAYRASRELT